MKRITRRRFLGQVGASLAGAAVGGSLVESMLARSAAAAAPAPATVTGLDRPMLDAFATAVAELEKKFPYASALFTAQGGIGITRDRKGKRVSQEPAANEGVALRVFDGSAFHETAVGNATPEAVGAAAKRLKRDVPLAKARFTLEPLAAHEEVWRTQMEQDPDALSLAERAALVDREFDRSNWDDPRVRNVTVTTNVARIRRVFVDRRRRLASETTMVSHSVFLFGFDQGRPGFGFARVVAQGGLERARITDEELERARTHVVETFGAGQVPPGEYDVVFAPAITGLLAHESFGHGVEMDQFVKQRARAQQFLGKPVAAPIVSLLDDPSIAGARGSYPFDDEGMLAAATTVIRDGVFVQPITDLMSATFLGTQRTPNGRTQAWDRKVYARMSNTFIARGTSDVAELMASLENGLYLEGFRNGIEDPHGWGIQFTANMAREVKRGKPTGKVFVPATVTGYVPEILRNVTLVANDFALDPGTCGKGFKEFVPVSSGGPHLRTRARVS